ncbi:hypothetical protein JTB14_019923 [Gonioctena quinquepunctata]|nr:hypothetical protein JTB14_019923 [Gonioctena quinquepunctata]
MNVNTNYENGESIRKKSRASYFRYTKDDRDIILALIQDYGNDNEDTIFLAQTESTETSSPYTDSDCSLSIDFRPDPGDTIIIEKPDEQMIGQTNTHQIPCQILNEVPKQIECMKSELKIQLGNWAISHNIDHSALRGLLKILKPYFNTLPNDAKTLLHIPLQTITKTLHPGVY